MALERNPEATAAMVETGWEMATHGYRWIDYQYIPEAVERVGTARASVYANLQPFLGAVFALVILSETMGSLEWLGGVAIAAGIVVSRTGSAKWKHGSPLEAEIAPHE
jgi:hypothetical protein